MMRNLSIVTRAWIAAVGMSALGAFPLDAAAVRNPQVCRFPEGGFREWRVSVEREG
jgi:hypothetical protein